MPKTTHKKDTPKKLINRREFMGAAAGAIVAPMIIPASARGADGHVAASNRINVAQIGMGRMGRGHTRRLVLDPGVEFRAVCDVDRTRRLNAKDAVESYSQGGGSSCKDYNDYRDVLARDDIDAVVIVTPDHWHTPISIHAAEAGKDVYCEKPVSLTITEGRQLVEAVQRHDCVFQNGSQYRSRPGIRRPCEFIRKGGLGKIKSAFIPWDRLGLKGKLMEPYADVLNASVTGKSMIPLDFALPEEPVPAGFDWDLWLGPAPWHPYNSCYHTTDMLRGVPWYFDEDFGLAASTQHHSHSAEVLQYAIGQEETGPVEIIHPSSGEYPTLTYRYPNGALVHLIEGNGMNPQHWEPVKKHYGAVTDDVEIKGNFGAVVVGEQGWLSTMSNAPIVGGSKVLMEEYNRPEHDVDLGGIDHHGNWLQCIKTREKPSSHEELGHRAAVLGQLTIIAYKLGRSLKFDPVREVFPEDEQANRLLRRAKRAPWRI
ncbi:MAG: Gfo/Idh/MocA family oxidoreductase [Opitutaceae bacterium]|nr:Gfo/Idh/MocA family oxidoreductase [Opitutaceae bacterium]